MKNVIKAFGIFVLAAMIGVSMTACGGGGSPSPAPADTDNPANPTSTVFESKDSAGNFYILEVTSASAVNASVSRAAAPAYTPQNNDIFTLTIILKAGGTWTTSGTVTVAGGSLTLSGMGDQLTVTITTEGMKNITGTITLDNGSTLTPGNLTPSQPVDPATITLNVNRWEDGENWNHGLNLSDVTGVRPKKDDRFRFRVRGTTDKTLEKASLSLEAYPADWSDYQWLGGSEEERLSGAFDYTFEINVYDEPKNGYFINLVINNNVAVPVSAKDWETMATISNFEVRLVGVNLPNNVYYGDEYIKNKSEAKKQTDFSFTFDFNDADMVPVPISKFIDGPASVKIINRMVILNLGTPKSEYLEENKLFGYTYNSNITEPSTKLFGLPTQFYTSDNKYQLTPWFVSGLVYASENTTLTRNDYLYHDNPPITLPLKKGWNWITFTYDEATNIYTHSTTTSQPGNMWQVVDN